MTYVKDKGSNLNTHTNIVKSIVSYYPHQLPTPFVGSCLAMQCQRQFNMQVIDIKVVRVFKK
jgi:hypothetical protein